MTAHRYSVLIASPIADEIDRQLSPMNGINAIDQIYFELSENHRPRTGALVPAHRTTPLYRALIEWCGLEVIYVEHGSTLYILDCSKASNPWQGDYDVLLQSDFRITDILRR